jgi:hypothetical protein
MTMLKQRHVTSCGTPEQPKSLTNSDFLNRYAQIWVSYWVCVPLPSLLVDTTEYFAVLKEEIMQYNIQPHNCYNMDEKGFLIGHLQKVKRIFPKALMRTHKLLGTGQDGARHWTTLTATICADGSSLPPALIYKAVSGNLQDTWLQD